MNDIPESTFLHHEACPKCTSSDALARYDDGHGHCFSCGYRESSTQDPVQEPVASTKKSKKSKSLWNDTDYDAVIEGLPKRMLTEETCRKFGYKKGIYKGKAVQVATYYKDNSPVAQKVRFKGKDFSFLGGGKDVPLYGQWLWDSGKMVVITEGEIDCLTVSQLNGNKWPVVSLPNGANGAKRALKNQLEWLERFETVVLMFDMDEPGMDAAKECAELFSAGKCKIASLPLKDPNEMLLEGRGHEVIQAIWNAKEYRPEGLVSFADIVDDIAKPVELGLPWFLEELTDLTFGRRKGEVYFFGAGTGIGKTDVFTQSMAYDCTHLKERVGVFYLEQDKLETGKRIVGKTVGKLFHIPGEDWTEEELKEAARNPALTSNLTLFDSFGVTDWEVLKPKITFLAHQGYRLFYIDHLTALATGQDGNERELLEAITADMAKLAKRLGIILHVISHLATPEGKSHEEGGRVVPRHFKGSRAIAFWAHFMFGLERNTLAEDPVEQKRTTFRVLKDRYTGRATGKFFYLTYDTSTGLLIPCDGNSEEGGDDIEDF